MNWMQKYLRSTIAGPIIALLLIRRVCGLITPRFIHPQNLSNVTLQVSLVAIVAIGATLVILTGGIDLSPGATVALGVLYTGAPGEKDGGTSPGGHRPGAVDGRRLGFHQWFLEFLWENSVLHRHFGDDEHLPRPGVRHHRGHHDLLRVAPA